ncbi:MAG TPA: DUF1554 domain-containing protein [Polyangiales bacterium]|nr:DUF1554 domain-containing protein [Polyangiales bacterium]
MTSRVIALSVLWLCSSMAGVACTDEDPFASDAAPKAGSAISFRDIRATEVTVSWGAAKDDVSEASKLQYKVLRATTKEALASLAKVVASKSYEVVQDYTAGETSVVAAGLSPATNYAFAVLVKDERGHEALYPPAEVTTLDGSAPTPGALTISQITASTLKLSWSEASDDVSSSDVLQYKVVMGANVEAIDTLEEAREISDGSGLLRDYTAALTMQEVTGLNSGKEYAFAVVVRDAAGNEALYSPVAERTLDGAAPITGTAINFSDITASGFTVNWGKATDNVSAQSALRYRLVAAVTTADIDTIAEVDALVADFQVVVDYDKDVTTHTLSDLSSSTLYVFAVVVEDEAGNKALYSPAIVRTLDVSAPTSLAPLSFTGVSATGITVQWTPASDDVTAEENLQYKVVRAATVDAIDTIAEVETITTGDALVKDYTANISSAEATGLTSSTSFAFAVVVRDEAGNSAIYTPKVMSTHDVTNPVLGTSIQFSDITDSSLNIAWGAATDDITAPDALQYKVVRAAAASDIDSLEEVDAIATGDELVLAFATGVTSAPESGLDSSTTYAFAVVVKDAAGNETLYGPATVATLDVSAPSVGDALSFSDVEATSITVSWGAGTDDVSDASDLQYKLVMAESAADIDSLEEVAAITDEPGLVEDFTAELTSAAVGGLTSSTTYAFAVVVRDAQGNEALYTPVEQATSDITPPDIGMTITFSSVASTSMTLHWGAASDGVTPAEDLEYKVVKSSTADEIDSLEEVDAITTAGEGLVQEFTANLTDLPVAGLSSSTEYAFAVVVRDAAGNESLYGPETKTTQDITLPTTGAAIAVSELTSSSLKLTWGAATDDITTASSLEYKVVRAATSVEIDTPAEADAITSGPALIVNYTANITSRTVTGLTPLSSYAFAVLVRDAAGNRALYTPVTQTTPDGNAPVVGTPIRFNSVSTSGITVTWGAGTDDSAAQADLQYKLVRAATKAAIDTVGEVNAITGPDLLLDWTANTTTKAVSGLSAGDFHFYATIVRDTAGNAALYAPNSRVAGKIFYLSTNTMASDFGGPTAADTLCSTLRDPRAATDVTPRAFLASGNTRRACSTANCTNPSENVDWVLLGNEAYYNTDGGIIGTTNAAGIFSFPLTNVMASSSTIIFTYSTINTDWTSLSGNCSGYTAVDSTGLSIARPNTVTNEAVYGANTLCSYSTSLVPISLLCVEP